jgi:hypothetical protein
MNQVLAVSPEKILGWQHLFQFVHNIINIEGFLFPGLQECYPVAEKEIGYIIHLDRKIALPRFHQETFAVGCFGTMQVSQQLFYCCGLGIGEVVAKGFEFINCCLQIFRLYRL